MHVFVKKKFFRAKECIVIEELFCLFFMNSTFLFCLSNHYPMEFLHMSAHHKLTFSALFCYKMYNCFHAMFLFFK